MNNPVNIQIANSYFQIWLTSWIVNADKVGIHEKTCDAIDEAMCIAGHHSNLDIQDIYNNLIIAIIGE